MRFIVVFPILGAFSLLSAHDVISTKITWSREISRIVYKRCASCHHEGGAAFALMTYDDARPWAKAIKEEVLERRMPPSGVVKGFGDFVDDRALTQEELHLVADWVEGGSPEGDPPLMPPKPDFSKAAAAPKTGAAVVVQGELTLKQPMVVAAIHPTSEAASVKAVVVRPDGAVEPLIWLYQYRPQFDRTFVLRKPMNLPAGTKIELFPAASIALLKPR